MLSLSPVQNQESNVVMQINSCIWYVLTHIVKNVFPKFTLKYFLYVFYILQCFALPDVIPSCFQHPVQSLQSAYKTVVVSNSSIDNR